MVKGADQAIFINQLKSKDKEAFALLYDNYSPALYGILLRILKSEALAEDVLQETFVKIWLNIGSYDNLRGSIFSWMLNIARNGAIDVLRSRTFRQDTKNQSLDNSVSMGVDRKTEQQVELIGLGGVVDKLSKEHRAIIELLYYKGYTQVEASKSLLLPLGTLKTKARAALKQLRSFLNEE